MVRFGLAQRVTRLRGQASPPTSSRRSLGRSRSMVASSVGQQAMQVTSRRSRKSASSSPISTTPVRPGTSVAPAISGTQISSTEKSNAMVMPW